MSFAVETKGLTKQFQTSLAVNSIDLQVPTGSTCGFLGRNGAGKTTTIKMLTGLKKPTSGEISIMGKREEFGKGIRPVGYLPDVPGFYGYMMADEFLMLCARLANVPASEQKSHITDLLKRVDMYGVKTSISGYSRGMRQRLGIAQALINSPPVVFLDEPISALDPMGRREVMEIIDGMKGSGTTVIFSTHILSDAESICDHIIIIEKGTIRVQESLTSLKEKWANDMAKIKFYEEAHANRFKDAMAAKNGGLSITTKEDDALEIFVRSNDKTPADISQLTAQVITEAGLPFRSFGINAPTLDDIFYEVTRNE